MRYARVYPAAAVKPANAKETRRNEDEKNNEAGDAADAAARGHG